MKTKQSILSYLRTTFCLVTIGGALFTLSSAQADRPGRTTGSPHFNNTSLLGAYGFSHDGVALTDSGGSIPLAVMGQLEFDGMGNVPSAVATFNFGGQILHSIGTGTYHVNADGTGSATFHVITVDPPDAFPPVDFTFEFVIDDARKTLQFISTTRLTIDDSVLDVVTRGRAERQ
jgi:hypothetical protein